MYLPNSFKTTSIAHIAALIEQYPLGMLITCPEAVPFVSHLPFLFEPSTLSQGKLIGHMAKANPQWQHFTLGHDVLVVFQGPNDYVSPTWYSTPGVPTWNYAVVHVMGKPQLIEDDESLEALVMQLTQAHEVNSANPWQPDMTGERRTRLLDMIVGFSIEITDIQAKFKLSQNRPFTDQQNVIAQLRRSGRPNAMALADLMTQNDGI